MTDERPKHCIQLGTIPKMNGYESLKRFYSVEGCCPTIPTCGGGNICPKVLVNEDQKRDQDRMA